MIILSIIILIQNNIKTISELFKNQVALKFIN